MRVRINSPNHRFHGREGELLGPEPWYEEQGHAPMVGVKVQKGPVGVTYVRPEETEPVEDAA